MKEFAVYTLARLGLFVASYAVVVGIYLLVAGDHNVPILWPFIVAMVMSAVASYYLLQGPRAKFAAKVDRRASAAAAAASRRFEEARGREDAD